jgi:hypothetical protein
MTHLPSQQDNAGLQGLLPTPRSDPKRLGWHTLRTQGHLLDRHKLTLHHNDQETVPWLKTQQRCFWNNVSLHCEQNPAGP